MNKAKILELAEQCFLRCPYDSPEKIFKLCSEFVNYVENWCERIDGPVYTPNAAEIAMRKEFDGRYKAGAEVPTFELREITLDEYKKLSTPYQIPAPEERGWESSTPPEDGTTLAGRYIYSKQEKL